MSTNAQSNFQALLDNPFIVSLAEWVWVVDDESDQHSAHSCLSTAPTMNAACWKQLIAKVIGIVIVLGACLNKLPVLRNIYLTQSTTGLSRATIYGEIILFANATAYGLLLKYPLTAYGEDPALLFQCVAILICMWRYSKLPVESSSVLPEPILALLGALLYLAFVVLTLPKAYYYLLEVSALPILLCSEGAQILETHRLRHTGAQSIVTITMNILGDGIRIFTTIQEMGWDWAVLSIYGFSVLLYVYCFAQYYYFQSNTLSFLANLPMAVQKKSGPHIL